MRKHILNVAAIILAVSASAFTSNHNLKGEKLVSYKWFKINTSRLTSQTVSNSDATYLGEGEVAPTDEDCLDDTPHQCVSGFTAVTQVNASNQIIGSQMPADIAYVKE